MAFNIFIIEMTLLVLVFQLVVSRFVKLILWSELTIMHEIQVLAFLFSAASNYRSEEAIIQLLNIASCLETVSMRFQWLVGTLS